MVVMKADIHAQLPLDPPLPGPGLPPLPVSNPVPLIDPPVPGQGDPMRDPPAGDPAPVDAPQAGTQRALRC